MLRCKFCVMPDTRPDVPFTDGVCQACLNHADRQTIDWDARREDLLRLLDRFHGECLVPSSGGKDSHFQVLKLRELGANVTTVTAMTCMPTEIGIANIQNLVRYAPGIRVEPNREVRKKLNRLGLTMVGDISWPEHVSIFTIPFRVARDNKKPLLFYGESPTNHYGGPAGTEQTNRLTARWRSEFGGFLGLRPADLVGVEGITEDDMSPYVLPDDLEGIEAHFLGQYVPWDSFENAKIANQAGMRQVLPTPANWILGENLDNAQTGIHDYFMFRKYGYGRGCTQVSMALRGGHAGLTRERALAWVKEYDGLVPWKYMDVGLFTILDHIGISWEKFKEIAEQFTNWDNVQKIAPYEFNVQAKESWVGMGRPN